MRAHFLGTLCITSLGARNTALRVAAAATVDAVHHNEISPAATIEDRTRLIPFMLGVVVVECAQAMPE